MLPEIFGDPTWQMRPCERAAVRGVLAELEPRLAVEIGTADGGSLRRIAAHAEHVHAFDLTAPGEQVATLANVTFHTGDSHELLPRALEHLATRGDNVDFVLVDGDHTAAGVRRDVEDLLASAAMGRSLIIIHDTANPDVRLGLDSIAYCDWPKVTWVDLDWLPGYVARDSGAAWAGLGLIVTDAAEGPTAGPASEAEYAVSFPELLAAARG